jgi:hypothetical protein
MNNIDSNTNNTDHKSNNTNYKPNVWFKDPQVLLDKKTLLDLWPLESMNYEEKINAISRFIIYITLAGVFLFRNIKLLVTGIIALAVLAVCYHILHKRNNIFNQKLKENFSDIAMYEKTKHNYTIPTTQNPIMNIQLPEIQDNPTRQPAAPAYNKAVENEINESAKQIVRTNFNDETIDQKLFNNKHDEFIFENSMRPFYATANTQVPNNQKEFAQFCYGNMASCKDGDVDMCSKNAPRHTNM